MRKGEYQDNLRADYKINNYNTNLSSSEKQKGKTLGKVIFNPETDELNIETKVKKD